MAIGTPDWWSRTRALLDMDYIDLRDTPGTYGGQDGKAAQVAPTEDGMEFSDSKPDDHSARHESGGDDEIDVTGLGGTYSDADTLAVINALTTVYTRALLLAADAAAALTALGLDDDIALLNDHSARHEAGGDDVLDITGLTPADHAARHENGGDDEIDVTGLTGLFTAALARAAINNIFGADGKADAHIDLDDHNLSGVDELHFVGIGDIFAGADSDYLRMTGSSVLADASKISIYGKTNPSYVDEIRIMIAGPLVAKWNASGVLTFEADDGAEILQPMLRYAADAGSVQWIVKSDVEVTVDAAAWTKVKAFQLARTGTLKSQYRHKTVADGTPGVGSRSRIYRNGAPVGTEHIRMNDDYDTMVDVIDGWSPGDFLELYIKGQGDEQVTVDMFRIYSEYNLYEVVSFEL